MNNDSGATVSLWMHTQDIPSPPPLTQDTSADVCVVGAGIAGMTAAYLLAKEGHSVVVLDDGPIGGGATGRTTAHISSGLDDGYREYERLHGPEGARLAAESAAAAIDLIERNTRDEGIDCDFMRLDAYLFNAPGRPQDILDRELEAAHRAGLTDVERLLRAPIELFDTGVCLRFPNQGQFHPLKYLAGLEQAIARRGGRIHCHTHAQKIQGGPGAYVESSDGRKVSAGAIVVATNAPVNDLVAIHAKQAAYRSYVIGARITRNSVPLALYWDTADPYHYARLQRVERDGQAEDYLIVGGEDHRTGEQTDHETRFARLEQWTREHFPTMEAVEFRWSGQILEPVDGLPYLGRNPGDADNVYIITGDSGDGMVNTTIGALLVTDLIAGRSNRWTSLYDPSRKPLGTLHRLVGLNLDVVAKYTEHLTGGEVSSADEIPPGTGAIVREGLLKVAVYRDPDGGLHKRSAVCTHLQCVVHWNDLEKTWDCPCHGSRFDTTGRVLNGPAITDLKPAE